MKKYKVLLNGQNYLLDFDGELRKFGFHTTRFVKASNQKEAETKAIALIHRDPTLVQNVLNGSKDPTTIKVDGAKSVGIFDLFFKKQDRFRFYIEDEKTCPG